MITIDQYDRDNLILLLNNADPHVEQQHNALCRILNIRNGIAQEFQTLSKMPKHITGEAVGITLVITLPIAFCVILAISSFGSILWPNIPSMPICIAIILLTIGLLLVLEEVIFHSIYKDALGDYNLKLLVANKEVNELTQYIYTNTMQHEELQIIPISYQNPYILQKVKGYLFNYRAANWMDSINLYEQERQLQQINTTLKQSMLQHQQLMYQELSLLRSIQEDNNFNALVTAGLIFFK